MNEIIKEYLPTNTAKILTALVLTSVPSSLFLYDFLKKIGIEISHLAKPEIRILITLSLLSLLFLLLIVHLLHFNKTSKSNSDQPEIESATDVAASYNIEISILTQIIKLRALNQTANPAVIAKNISSEAQIVLANLNKLHNEQQVTYITGGKPPTIETDFFISPKGLDRVSFQASIQKRARRIVSPGVRI